MAEVVAAPGFVAPEQPDLPQLGMSVGDFVLTHNNALGGCVMFRKDAFLKLGGYNREFVGWGWEDNEIYNRFLKCGLKSYRCASTALIHLDHFRGEHSIGGQDNYRRFKKIRWLSWRKLVVYINRSLGGCLAGADVRRWRLMSYGRLGGLFKTLMRR